MILWLGVSWTGKRGVTKTVFESLPTEEKHVHTITYTTSLISTRFHFSYTYHHSTLTTSRCLMKLATISAWYKSALQWAHSIKMQVKLWIQNHACTYAHPQYNGPYPPWWFVTSQNKDGCDNWGTFVRFVWTTMGRKFLNNHILTKKEDIKL